jgi:hypothetical protein
MQQLVGKWVVREGGREIGESRIRLAQSNALSKERKEDRTSRLE